MNNLSVHEEGSSINEVAYKKNSNMLVSQIFLNNRKTMLNSFEDTFKGFNSGFKLKIHSVTPTLENTVDVLVSTFQDGFIQNHHKYSVRIYATPVV